MEHAAVMAGNRVYVFGGHSETSTTNRCFVNDFLIYDYGSAQPLWPRRPCQAARQLTTSIACMCRR